MSRFPAPEVVALPSDPDTFASLIEELIAKGRFSEGYVRATGSDREAYLFFVKGKIHAAGQVQEDRPGLRSVNDFFSSLARAKKVEAVVADAGLVLCMSALFRKAPSAQLPVTQINGTELLAAVRQTGKNAVVVVRSGDARSLVFCKSGEPAMLYQAEGEHFPSGQTVSDQVVGYAQRADFATIDLYDDIRLPASEDAGKPLRTYLPVAKKGITSTGVTAVPAGGSLSLLVRLGDRVVFQMPIVKDVTSVGRSSSNDLALDNLSVSRKHAMVLRAEGRLVVMDLGSENGILLRGQKVERAVLSPGDEVTIGKYTLVWPRHGVGSSVPVAGPFGGVASDEDETVFMSMKPPETAMLVHGSRMLKMTGAMLRIGSDPKADLSLKGLLIAAEHARITREKNGTHRLKQVAGMRKLRVNGKPVTDAVLADGDVITLAGHEIRFVSVAPSKA